MFEVKIYKGLETSFPIRSYTVKNVSENLKLDDNYLYISTGVEDNEGETFFNIVYKLNHADCVEIVPVKEG